MKTGGLRAGTPGLDTLVAGFAGDGLEGVPTAFDVNKLDVLLVAVGLDVLDRSADGDVEAVELAKGTGRLPKGLGRGELSLTSGRDAIFLTGLDLVGLLGLEGLSRMFLNRFEVLDPVVPPFNLGVLICRNGLLSGVSFVNSSDAFLLPLVGEEAAEIGDKAPF